MSAGEPLLRTKVTASSSGSSEKLTSGKATVGGSPLGLEFQWLGVTRASNFFVILLSYVFFMFYIDEINPRCKGNLSCKKTTA